MKPLPKLAIALDAPSIEPLEPLLDELHGLPVLIKVGLSLFCAVGPSIVHHMRLSGFDVFLDLKLHDIPHQVAMAVQAVAKLDVALVTVHAAGGRPMLEAAVAAAKGRTRIVGVSVLTSLNEQNHRETSGDLPLREVVVRRLRLCRDCGLDGAVLGATELDLTAEMPANFVRVVPGIRPLASDLGDQARVATPAEAMRAGATLLVVGRPIAAHPHPRQAAEAILAEINANS